MSVTACQIPGRANRHWGPVAVAGLLALALALSAANLATWLPWHAWPQLLEFRDQHDFAILLAQDSWLPRLCVSVLCGAILGLSGVLFQQVLRNPLAEPMTLGVSAGAQLALTLGAIAFPAAAGAMGQTSLALIGAGVAAVLVFGVSWRSGLTPVTVAVAGLVVSLYCGAIGVALQLFHAPYLRGIFIWGGGALAQQDWHDCGPLAVWLLAGAACATTLLHPLTLFELGDTQARSLGMPVRLVRLVVLTLAVTLAGAVVAYVGVIGFVGLAAPALARLCGARRLRARVAGSVAAGALLLWLTDQVVQRFVGGLGDLIPAGAATALFGAPVMLVLLARLPHRLEVPADSGHDVVKIATRRLRRRMLLALALLAMACLAATFVGRAPIGWRIDSLDAISQLAPWRLPRMFAALAAGAMLAVAGTLMQRVTANPMASPDLTGVSAGAALGLLVCVVGLPEATHATRAIACVIGAASALTAVAYLARRSRFEPTRVVLIGVALGALSQALLGIAIAGGGDRAAALLAWLGGSTYAVTGDDAWLAVIGVVVLSSLAVFTLRWLTVLPLGEPMARSLGVRTGAARGALLLLVAALTGLATLVTGPLSFVGLTMPHCARMLGARRPGGQIALSALLGAIAMVLADWLGRTLFLPRELPAGLIATAICAPYLLWLLARRPRM